MNSFEIILILKSIHIIGVVVWFAGLFYLGRLFVYDREARDEDEPARSILLDRFAVMERRLYYAITWPGMAVTIPFGAALTVWYAFPWWLQIKIALVLCLVAYHLMCGRLRKQLAAGTCRWTSRHFRMWNEVPTLLLFAIVFLVVMKDSANVAFVGLGLLALGVVVIATVRRLAR